MRLSSAEAQSREHRERRSSRTLCSERASVNGAESSCARVNRLECSSWNHFETWRRASEASGGQGPVDTRKGQVA